MKNLGVSCILFLCSIGAIAGVTDTEWAFKEDPSKRIEDAVILYHKGIIDHTFTRELSKHTFVKKIKFFSKKGIEDYGTVKLTFDSQDENIGDIEGKVYLPDGTAVSLTDSDIHKKKVSTEWGDKETEISIVFPSLTEGAIVEFSYYRSYKGLNDISKWTFQNDLYTVYSEVKFIAWPTRMWGLSMVNQMGEVEQSNGRHGQNKSVVLSRKNIPPLKREAYTLADSALKETLFLYYLDTDFKVKNYWQERGKTFYKNELKKWLKKNKKIQKIAQEKRLVGKDTDETIKNIHDFVISTFHTFSTAPKKELGELDKAYFKNLFKANSAYDLLDFKVLPSMYMNFIESSLIQSTLPEAQVEFVSYSPWNKQLFNPNIKTMRQFTESMLKVTVNGKVYWLSPGAKFLPVNVVQWSAKSAQLYVMNSKECRFEKLPLDTYSDNVSNTESDIFFEDDRVRIEKKETYNRYRSFSLRKTLAFYEEKEVRDLFEESVIDDFGQEAELVTYKIDNLNDLEKPVIVTMTISYPYAFEEAGDNYFMELLGIFKYSENKFNVEKRLQNIIFNYSYETTEDVTYHLPDDFKLSSIPKNVSVNTNTFMYRMNFEQLNDNTFRVKTLRRLEQNMFAPNALQYFKRTLNDIITAGAQKIRLEEVL